MKKYLKNILYIMKHKKYVFIECWKVGLYRQAFTHDISKFSPFEFYAYAWKFFAGEQPSRALMRAIKCENIFMSKEEVEERFEMAWIEHYSKNKHHWQYWLYDWDKGVKLQYPKDMPLVYMKEMVCDWRAMSRKFGDSAQNYYMKNYNKMDLSWRTRMDVELELGLNDSDLFGYGHTLKEFATMLDEKSYKACLGEVDNLCGLDTYNLLKE